MVVDNGSSSWSREQDKAFESALVHYPEDCVDRWENIAAVVPGKTADDIRRHYEILVEDVNAIQAGLVPLPNYIEESAHNGKTSRMDQERRKGIAWTEEEHRLFLLGLDKYGKGDWRSISRNFVVSRTPTQVASHAQKYFIRLNSMNKERRRTSIHDITTAGVGEVSAPQGPTTGQMNGYGPAELKSTNQSSHSSGGPLGVGMYGSTIGQPVGGPLVSAVGTPVNLPVPIAPHMAYGMQAPVPGTMVPGAPMQLARMNYPMPHHASSAQRQLM